MRWAMPLALATVACAATPDAQSPDASGTGADDAGAGPTGGPVGSSDTGEGSAGDGSRRDVDPGTTTASPPDADAPLEPGWPAFGDVSSLAHVSASHVPSFGHHAIGQAWADYDRDGWLDLYVTGGLAPSVLYHNEGDGTFTVASFDDIALPMRATAGPAWGDYDNDGWLDLYVTCDGSNALFRNDAGVGFTEVTNLARVGDPRYGVMASWGDFDADGWLDLYVANHGGDHDRLYHNEGDGTFTDISELIGADEAPRAAFASTFLDYDLDGDLDLHVVNDHVQGDRLFRNDGPGCEVWCLTDVSAATGADLHINGMGQAVGDYDNDGDLDLFFSDIRDTHFLRNLTAQGHPAFELADTGTEFSAVSWGTVFLDFDNDGWLDLYLATQDSKPLLSNRLFRNLGDGTFEDVTALSGAADTSFTYGVAYADYDHDGFVDLVVGDRGEGYRLYRNTTFAGPGHHWVTFALEGRGPVNRDAIGARVTVTDTEGVARMSEVRSGSTMGGGNSMRLHFGLGAATVDQVDVRWPDGRQQTRTDIPTDALVELIYPR